MRSPVTRENPLGADQERETLGETIEGVGGTLQGNRYPISGMEISEVSGKPITV